MQTKIVAAQIHVINAWNEVCPEADKNAMNELISEAQKDGMSDQDILKRQVSMFYDGLAYGNWPSVCKQFSTG